MIPTIWKETKEHALRGAPRKFKTPEELAEACIRYFDWCENALIEEEVLVSFQGQTTKETKAHPSAMLLSSLCLFVGIDITTWRAWRTERPDLSPVIEWAEKTIYDQKFRGAAGGMFNANIIARDLGLADKSELTGKDGGPIETMTIDPSKLSTGALKEILAARNDAKSDDS
jgi:hypothetical protein